MSRLQLRNIPYSYAFTGSGGVRVQVDGTLANIFTNPNDLSFSITGYVRSSEYAPTENKRLWGSASASLGMGCNMLSTDRRVLFFWTRAGGNIQVTSTTIMRPGVWYFVAQCWQQGTTASNWSGVILPVGNDLTALSSFTITSDTYSSATYLNSEFLLGARSDNDLEWNGNQADVQYHNKSLSLAELKAIYHKGLLLSSCQSRWLGPKALGSGVTITDEVGSNSGTASGGSWSTDTPLKLRSSASGRTAVASRSSASGRSAA